LGFISPVVARMAAEHNLDLYAIEGRGRGGRITKNDVLAYMEHQTAQPAASQTPAAAEAPVPTPTPTPQPVAAAPPPPRAQATPGSLIPHSTVRRAIAEHMVQSKRTSPHVTTVMEVDLSRVVAHRQAHKTAFEREGVKLTFTPYFISAVVAALKAHPLVNASWRDDGVYIHARINIGMATSLGDEGLIVPVIKDAGQFSLAGLASIVNDLAERARARQLKPDEVKVGTFTITNHGVSGSLFAMPIINQPQCAILGVGVIQKRVVVVSGPDGADSIAIRPMAYLSLTFDHRILDGAAADHFLAKVVNRLQEWPQDD
ncbi:MAG TPA: dihydrolipoamide acetyltransferase family protein, partial [Anaerolineales bacterium]|nr:dihydrolipoamide acetyltransferase family protein [Anaerolineales bacterium]